jgi:hypothetical protein
MFLTLIPVVCFDPAANARTTKRRRAAGAAAAVEGGEGQEVPGAAAAVPAGRRGNAVGHSSTSSFKGVTR